MERHSSAVKKHSFLVVFLPGFEESKMCKGLSTSGLRLQKRLPSCFSFRVLPLLLQSKCGLPLAFLRHTGLPSADRNECSECKCDADSNALKEFHVSSFLIVVPSRSIRNVRLSFHFGFQPRSQYISICAARSYILLAPFFGPTSRRNKHDAGLRLGSNQHDWLLRPALFEAINGHCAAELRSGAPVD